MPHVDHTPSGGFCWMELATSDTASAKAFYTALFGWQFIDTPTPAGIYTKFTLHNRNTAACYALQPDHQAHGIPSHWSLYIAVESADDAAARVKDSGGKVLCGPFDVATHGRSITVADPTGVVFSLWQPGDNKGIGIANEPRTFCWADLSTPDPARAARFYTDVFGWQIPDTGAKDYRHILNGGHPIGGIPPMHHPPPHWLLYFQAADCDLATAKARQLGGSIVNEPTSIDHVGRMSLVSDPQGAIFSLFQPFPHS